MPEADRKEVMKRKSTTLYNVMFPIWFFFFYPTFLWLIILPVNFGIDSLVLWLSAKKQGIEDRKKLWKQSILWIWMIGFFSDFMGGLACLGLVMITEHWLFSSMHYTLVQFVSGIPGVIIAGVLIYFLNQWLSFRKTDLTKEQIKKTALYLAIFTAPYAMLVPIYW